MKLIVGLGNPGRQYAQTLHNTGALVLDVMVQDWQKAPKNIPALIHKRGDILFAKPTTYMNVSGKPTQQLLAYYDIPATDLIVIHDDIDLLMGDVKTEKNRGAGGHNGVRSIIQSLGGEKAFTRIRVGVATPKTMQQEGKARDVSRIVLKKPGLFSRGAFQEAIRTGANALTSVIE